MKTIGYVRTSTGNQNLGLEVQKKAMEYFKPEEIFCEQVSGRKENRKELNRALEQLSKGDTLLIYNLSRLGRSSRQLVNLMAELEEKGIYLKSIQDSLDTSTPSGRFVFTILSGVSQLEAEMVSERTKSALAVCTKPLGNPGTKTATKNKIIRLYSNKELSLKTIAQKCGVSEKTVYNIAKRAGLSRK